MPEERVRKKSHLQRITGSLAEGPICLQLGKLFSGQMRFQYSCMYWLLQEHTAKRDKLIPPYIYECFMNTEYMYLCACLKERSCKFEPYERLDYWQKTLSNCKDKLLFYLGFYVAFNTVQVISRRVVGRAEETSPYSSLGFCTVNCRPTASNYQLSHLRP